MASKTLYIKNMVCNRCIQAVEEELINKGIDVVDIRLGEVKLAREIAPDFSMRYFINLRRGGNPRPIDYQALAVGLNVEPYELLDGSQAVDEERRRMIREFCSVRMERPDLADNFVDYVEKESRFRNKSLTRKELYPLFRKFLDERDQK